MFEPQTLYIYYALSLSNTYYQIWILSNHSSLDEWVM